MADRFYSDIEVPEIAVFPGPAAAGFVKIFGRDGKVFGVSSSGTEYDLTGGSTSDLTIDGGFANSVYLSSQSIDGGDANG